MRPKTAIVCLAAIIVSGVSARLVASFCDQRPPHAVARIAGIEPIEPRAGHDWSTATLRVYNDGTRRMIVRLRDADCGCSGKSKSAKIAPGESKQIEMEVYTNYILEKPELKLVVTTTDPTQPKIPVTFLVESLPSTVGAVSVLESN